MIAFHKHGASILLFGAIALFSSCAGRNIHRDLGPSPQILTRQFTLPTRPEGTNAGDRGTEFSNAVFRDDTLVFGNRTTGVVAFYPGMRQTRWTLKIPNGVVSELALDKSSVYFGGGDGNLYSVNLENGHMNWQYLLRNPVISRPVVRSGRVFVTTSDDTVYALDAGTGQWLWHYKRRSGSSGATIHGASEPLVEDDEVIVGMSDGFVVSLSVQEGKLKWERKIHQGTKFTDVDAHPVLDGQTLYIPSYDGALYALNRKAGEVLWRFDAGGSKQIILEEGKIYLPSSDGTIYALQQDTARVLWKFELDRGTPTRMISTDQYLIFGSSYQYLYVIDKATGKGVYRYNVGYGSGFTGSPAFDPASGSLYWVSGSGNLMAFSLRKPPRKMFAHGKLEPYVFE